MRLKTPVHSGSFAVTDFGDRKGIAFNSGSKYGEFSKCPRKWDGKQLDTWADPLSGLAPWMENN
jgi:hypothetical protein